MNIKYWRKFKKILIIFSSILGVLIPIACFFLIPSLNIFIEPLSKFGVSSKTKYLWLFFTQIISILLYINNLNIISEISESINSLQLSILKYINIISIISLSMAGIINMNFRYPHLIFATIFFLFYTAFIFWFGVYNIRYNLKVALFSIITSLLILSSTLSIKMGYGYGIFEIIFITSIIIWNIRMSFFTNQSTKI